MARLAGYGFVILALIVPTGIVAMLQGGGVFLLPYNLHVVDLRLPGIFRLHMLASGAAMLLVPLAIYAGVKRHRWHRALGRSAAIAVIAGGLTSFPVAILSESAALARAGFIAQGTAWLVLLAWGVAAIRARRIADHQRAMLAMAAVTTGAIWVRATTTIATSWDLPFDPLYAAAAWLGWLVPLILAWNYAPSLSARLART